MVVQRRTDEDGKAYTQAQIQSFYRHQYSPAAVAAYWKSLPVAMDAVNSGPKMDGMRFDVEGKPCTWLDTEAELGSALAELSAAAFIAIDVEGNNLGHKGRASTIQLATREACYVVDLATLGMPRDLRELLEGSEPLKFCHGFSGDQINLIEQFGVDFNCSALFDTQIAARALPEYTGKLGVVDILSHFAPGAPASVLDEMLRMKQQLERVDFLQRPLPVHVVRYSCLDVIYLGSAGDAMKQLLPGGAEGVKGVLQSSIYRGHWARGACYKPPTQRVIEDKERKGLTWSEEKRDFIKMR